MRIPFPGRNAGFTYLAALFIIIIMGIMLGMMGQYWSYVMKREREEELFFRGSQILEAIAKWKAREGQPGMASMPIQELKQLEKAPWSLSTVRYLRRVYTDPITGKDFKVISDPQKGIIGVHSESDVEPLKKAGFPISSIKEISYKSFEGKKKYSEWKFVYGQVGPQLSVILPPIQ